MLLETIKTQQYGMVESMKQLKALATVNPNTKVYCRIKGSKGDRKGTVSATVQEAIAPDFLTGHEYFSLIWLA